MKITVRHWLILASVVITLLLLSRFFNTHDSHTVTGPTPHSAHSQPLHSNPPAKAPVPPPTPVNTPTPPVKMSSVADMVRKLIADNIVMVFSKSYCPYCAKAKRYLGQYSPKGLNIVELDQRNDGSEIQRVLGEITGGTSVPRVFINGKFIGGGDDTERLDREGKLKPMLEQAGAL